MVFKGLSVAVKCLSLLTLLIFLLFSVGEYPGWYSMGWVTGRAYVYFNPFTEVPALMVCLPLLLGCWIVSLLLRRDRIWTTAMMVAALVTIGLMLYVLPPPGSLTVYGIRDHIMKVATLDDLRNLAREIDKDPILVDQDETIEPPVRLKALQQRYPFLAWGLGGHGNPYVRISGDVLNVFWGGTLPGRWGFSVSANGAQNDPPAEPDLRVIRMSNDIYFFHGD